MTIGQGLAVASIAQNIMDAMVRHFGAATGVSLPHRRIIAPGDIRLIAHDNCEQFILALAGIGLGQAPGQGGTPRRTGTPISAGGLRHAVFAMQIVRFVPESQDGSTPPDADVVTAAGLNLMRDAGLMSQALVEVCAQLAASLSLGHQGSVQPGAVEMVGPEGGVAAVEGSLVITAGELV